VYCLSREGKEVVCPDICTGTKDVGIQARSGSPDQSKYVDEAIASTCVAVPIAPKTGRGLLIRRSMQAVFTWYHHESSLNNSRKEGVTNHDNKSASR
jgi:hypothetical protein